jgi:hypothetical protein
MKMMSLYDYLGRAAGFQLGEEVAKVALTKGVPMSSRHVSNPAYEGKVALYPESFLKEYFGDSE